jgi:hypothetical protein
MLFGVALVVSIYMTISVIISMAFYTKDYIERKSQEKKRKK